MSDTKAKPKANSEKKKVTSDKADKKPKESEKAAKGGESSASEKAEATPKSASQTSISHFSSVSTPAYKAGWDNIFGGSKGAKEPVSKATNTVDFPDTLSITDEEIDKELRAALYKAFQRQARRQGLSLAKIKKLAKLEYSLKCDLIEK